MLPDDAPSRRIVVLSDFCDGALASDRSSSVEEVTAAAMISNCSAMAGFGLKAYLPCRFRIIWIISIPPSVAIALANDLKLGMGRTRRLIAPMIVLHAIVEVLALADRDRRRLAP